MTIIKLLDGTVFQTARIERKVELANPTQQPITFFITFDFEGKQHEVPYASIAYIKYE